ncbi:hypothetical protein D3C80_1821440 [compost metagenome]
MVLQQKLKIPLVFFRDGRDVESRSRKINALSAADRSPYTNPCGDTFRIFTCHFKLDFPVID